MPAAHFLFSGDDVPKITSLTMDEAGPEPGIPVGTWRLRFRQNSPGPVQIRPLLPGGMRFIADPAEAGGLPTPDEVSFAAGASSGWRTRGRLMIRTGPGATRGIATDLPIVPNRLWYGPVELSEPFLFETLCSKLARKKVLDANQKAVQPSRKDWANHAVSEFLAGEYEPHLTLDDIGRFLMPTVVVPDSGDIELLIGAALWQTPFDGPMSAFDDPPFRDDDPDHPANGPIPARAVYRSVRPHLVSEQESEPLRDLMLAEWPDAPRFFPIRFTRTWEPVPECSVHLPRQLLSISLSQTVVQEHPLPAHGVVLFRQDPEPSPPQPGSPTVAIVLAGTMTWLLGGGPTWLNRGATDPVEIDLAAVEKPHVVVRLPMAAAILADWRRPEPGGGACTYISLRRTVRAFVDNRIAGGRLAAPFPTNPTRRARRLPQGENKAETHGIVSRAFAETAALVCHGAPNAYPSGDPDEDDGEFVASLQDLAESLLQVLEVLFPEPAEQHGDNDGTVKSEGWRTFMLWQSRVDRFKPPDLHDNFDPDHVGRGSAGAMRALGLGDDHVNPAPADDESEAYFNGIVEEMRIGLVPGAVLQFWTLNSDFKKVSAREGGLADSGHSPLFLGYRQNESGTVTGLRLLDQTGESDNPMSVQGGNRRLTWNNAARAIWIAANWLE